MALNDPPLLSLKTPFYVTEDEQRTDVTIKTSDRGPEERVQSNQTTKKRWSEKFSAMSSYRKGLWIFGSILLFLIIVGCIAGIIVLIVYIAGGFSPNSSNSSGLLEPANITKKGVISPVVETKQKHQQPNVSIDKRGTVTDANTTAKRKGCGCGKKK